jgi:hypothetical protein
MKSIYSLFFKRFFLSLLPVLAVFSGMAQSCPPISTLPCEQVQVSLPVRLTFSDGVAGTVADQNSVGTGFTMVASYSGTRLSADGTPSNTSVPGYEPSKLTIGSGRLQLVTNKGIALTTSNNQLNTLGVGVDSRSKLLVETTLISPFKGTQYQQGGLWFGLSDKTFVKLVVVGDKVELKKEVNDVSSSSDGRITAAISGLNTQTVRLRLVVDPAANTAEGFYSTDGTNYVNVGQGYTAAALSISGMGLTSSTAYAGIFATHRNSDTPVTYSFDDFAVSPAQSSGNGVPAFAAGNYSYSVSDGVVVGASVGNVEATDPDGDALTYSIAAGNTNSSFAVNATTGAITVAKKLNYHTQASYLLTVRASDGKGGVGEATAAINVSTAAEPSFSTVSWATAASQPYTVNEAQGKVVNGKLYTFGGFDSQKACCTTTSRAYVYDPVANSWAAIAPMPPMNGTSYGGVTHAGFTTDGTDIYFAGGYTSNSSGTGQIFGTKEAWKYVVAENRYVRLPDLPVAISAGQLEYLNGRLHHIAGTNTARTLDLGDHYVLDLDNLAAGWKTLALLPNPRQHAGSAVYEGKIYFIGGQTGHDDNLVTRKEVHRYDPVDNSWAQVADLPVPSGANGRGHISQSVVVVGSRVIVLGGETVHGTGRTNMVSAYSAAGNSWENLTVLPNSRYSGVAAALGGGIYYTGGSNSSTTYKGSPAQTSTKTLAYAPTQLSFAVQQDGTTSAQSSVLSASEGTPTVALSKSANSNWLILPSSSSLGSQSFSVNASGLAAGSYSATVTASAADYTSATLEVKLDVTGSSGGSLADFMVNFQDDATAVPAGWLKDFGEAFGARTGANQGSGMTYGWKRVADGSAVDLSKNGRNRKVAGVDPVLNTFMHMQLQSGSFSGTIEDGLWEAAVPNGEYDVTVSVGDPSYYDSKHTINAEGIRLINGFVPSKSVPHATATTKVSVTDGYLTIDAIGGTNTKINSVVIRPATTSGTQAIVFTHTSQTKEVRQGSLESILNYIHTSDSKNITVSLKAVEEAGNVPVWLRVNGKNLNGISYTAGSEISFELDATNLSIGTYKATVTASATGYADATVALQLDVTTEGSVPLADFKINFQDDATAVPSGWLKDFGQAYGPRTGASQGSDLRYGWKKRSDGTPVDLTLNGRNRKVSGLDPVLNTFMHMQMQKSSSTGTGIEGIWEAEVPNGNYDVTVSVGDASYYDSKHTINVEGFRLISEFVPAASSPFSTATITVTVADGFLTLDAIGGTNTKINSVIIKPSTSARPYVRGVSPTNGSDYVSTNTSVSTEALALPNGGVNNTSLLASTVKLKEVGSGTVVTANINGTGGGDAITLVPQTALKPSTWYRFEITDGVKDQSGAAFIPYASTFKTGDVVPGISGIASFERTILPNSKGQHTTLAIGPDGKLYASTIDGKIKRFTIKSDGTLDVPQVMTPVGNRMIIGLAFDPASTATNPIVWITHSTLAFVDGPQWDGKLTRLSGANLESVQNVLVNLPRSYKDHLTNSIAFGPDGALYFTQGSMSAMGRADNTWGNREETLLSGAVLRLDLSKLSSMTLPVDVKTAEGGTYSPYTANSPLTLYATGVRNAYDLVWHSNGQLYVPTNGSAAGGNTPASVSGTLRPDGSLYNGPAVPALTNVNQTVKDYLYQVQKGGFYGHPNPTRGEYAMNGGNPTSDVDPGEVNTYPIGTLPDANWKGYIFDFQANKSPNGVIEYKGSAFGGALKGMLMVVRYSQNDDIIMLEPGANNNIVNAIEGLSIPGFSGFFDPLDLIEDVRTGYIYVSEFGGDGQISLLKPKEDHKGIVLTPERVVDNDVADSNAGINRMVTVFNTASADITVSGVTLGGANPDQYVLGGLPAFPRTISPGTSFTFNVALRAASTGLKTALIQVASNDGNRPVATVELRGLGTSGLGGSNEPSLQAVFNVHNIPVNVGDDDASTNVIHSNTTQQKAALLGDEISVPTFQKAEAGSVTIEPLAVFGPTTTNPIVGFGWYRAGDAGAKAELFTVSNSPASNGQTVNVNLTGSLSFDPGANAFGLYSRWPFFENRHVYSEDALNTFSGSIPHHVRVYALKDVSGAAVPNAYIVAFEEHTSGFDYQDVVCIVRNVKPAAPAGSANSVKVNFGPANAAAPEGYVADQGLAYEESRSFGWIDEVSKAPKANDFGRVRSTSDELRLRTLNHLQHSNNPRAAWEYNVANGMYQVTVSAGDASYYDSKHTVNVEGVTAINQFVPTSSQKFMSGTVTVSVSDGKLTLDANGGTNTKINYVIIDPVIKVNLIGTLHAENTYRNQVEVSILGTEGAQSVQYSLNGGAFQAFEPPMYLKTAGSYSLRVKVVEASGKEIITEPTSFSIIEYTNANNALFVENRDKFPSNDHVTFARIQIPWVRAEDPNQTYAANHDLVTLRIHNKGVGSLNVTGLVLSNPAAFSIETLKGVAYDAATALPLTVSSGTYADLVVRFIAADQGTRVKVLHETLTVLSNDDKAPEKKIHLHGLWQYKAEGNNEPYAQEIIEAFGFRTKAGFGKNDPDKGDPTKLKGDEILSPYFVRADMNKPVYVRQMAAYHQCCIYTETFRYHEKGSTTRINVHHHIKEDGQSLLPRKSLTGTPNTPAEGAFSPATPFGIVINKDYTDPRLNPGGVIGTRVWKVIDADGNVVPDAYIVGNDYLGTDVTNYDYQDNIYYVSNIRPEVGSVPYSLLATNPSALDFGEKTVKSSNSFTLNLSSLGKVYEDGSRDPAILIRSVEIVGQNQSEFSVAMPAKTVLNPQEFTTLTVKFNPTFQGFKVADLLIHYANGKTPHRVPLYGIALDMGTSVNVHHRINAGSPHSVTINGKTWSQDMYAFDNLEPYSNPVLSQIQATDEDVLYLTEQSSNYDRRGFRYEIPVANGNYVVRLHFAEIYWGVPNGGTGTSGSGGDWLKGAGQRVFSVAMEGKSRLMNFDIFQEVGGASAVIRNFPVSVTDGKLNINFTAVVNRPMVSAIEVYSLTNSTGTTVAVSSVQALEPSATVEKAKVYPNPVADRFSIDFPSHYEGKVSLTMIDAAGRKIKVGDYNLAAGTVGMEVNIAPLKLNRGLYFLRVEPENGGGEVIKLIVK